MHAPPITAVFYDNTHRIIPSKWADEAILSKLAEEDEDLKNLYELEGATNPRLLAETGRAPGISVHELVFAIPNAAVINAAFCHPNPNGGRFNTSLRGAWYSAVERQTSIAEITHHLRQWILESHWKTEDWTTPQEFNYTDFLADFRGGFHDIRKPGAFRRCLIDDYTPSQQLSLFLLAAGSSGIVYGSVRRKVGTCIACFRPALVLNVRRDSDVTVQCDFDPETRNLATSVQT